MRVSKDVLIDRINRILNQNKLGQISDDDDDWLVLWRAAFALEFLNIKLIELKNENT